MRQTKNDYIKNKIKSVHGNCKGTWKIFKKLLNGEEKNAIKEIDFGDRGKEKDTKQIARKMNEYFIESIKTINESIKTKDRSMMTIDEDETPQILFKFQTIDKQQLLKIIENMKNKPDANMVTPKMLIDSFPIIGGTICDIINESLTSGVFPDSLKISTVIPAPKVSRSIKCEDYRPINMLDTIEKLVETIVKNQMVEFLEKNNILANEQSGYRAKHSCETALNGILADWKNLREKNNEIICVFLDLKRAFETIDRRLLLEKMKKYGFDETVIKWFESYLTNRKHKG